MSRPRGQVLLAAAAIAAVFGFGCGSDDDHGGALEVAAAVMPPAEVGPRASVALAVEVRSERGVPRSGVEVTFAVEHGGGTLGGATVPRVVSAVVESDAQGRAMLDWTVGVVPVVNRLTASVGASSVAFATRVALAEPLQPSEFGDIPGFLREAGYTAEASNGAEVFLATTEDLAFVGEDRLLLGLAAGTSAVEGALIEMNSAGEASLVPLSGEPLVGTLGVAVDRDGTIWVADPRRDATGALVRISGGVAATAVSAIGDQDLHSPNHLAIGTDGRVYVSDPCLGIVFRYDPASDVVDAVVTMDVALEGGPNGLAFDRSGANLYFATESIALLCGRPDLPLTDPVAGLFRVQVSEAGFGSVEAIAERRGLFGDGLGFDAEDNLYVIFDTEANFMLEESAVWVLPAGETEMVKFLASRERVFANLAWGRGSFGDETLYLSLLAVDAFGLPIRGVDRIDVGIPGLPLLP